jgi:hypothetical protein
MHLHPSLDSCIHKKQNVTDKANLIKSNNVFYKYIKICSNKICRLGAAVPYSHGEQTLSMSMYVSRILNTSN